MTLSAADFPAFVGQVHPGRQPFPWQQALVAKVMATGCWPDVIDVPTGLGKTGLLDVAVFVAAASPQIRRRRIYFVVDRRLVVDEAHQHAQRIQQGLAAAAPGSVAAAVAGALRGADYDGPALEVTRMRGGATWDRLWLQRPDRTAIVTGTVDQIGSRLLFRGYGVTEHARSIDAALVGTDSLLLIDEAHLAEPFLTTLADAISADRWALTAPPVVVTMSATTPAATAACRHGIGPDDEAHPVAGVRLHAAKRLHLVQVRTTKTAAEAAMAEAIATLTARVAGAGVTGVVVNTVAKARAVFTQLRQQSIEAVLLTGRTRGVDRDYLLAAHYRRLAVDRDRATAAPLVLVATQTVEVGANIDVDTLITESASWPALVQRLGRLNRLGLQADAHAVVVHPSSAHETDPVYGAARLATWTWLTSHAEAHPYSRNLDPGQLTGGLVASPAALRQLTATAPDDLREPQPYTPVLLPATLDAWTRTSPTPHPDPPVAPYLHGVADTAPAVAVVWRSELDTAHQSWPRALDTVPPATDEALEVPLAAVRRWLAAAASDPTVSDRDDQQQTPADVGHVPGPASRFRNGAGQPLVLRYRDRADATVISVDQIRPGDLIVVPTTYGGCDQYGWHPESITPVIDVADLANRPTGPILRLGSALATAVRAYHHAPPPALAALASANPDDLEWADITRRHLAQLAAAISVETPLGRNLHRLSAGARLTPIRSGSTGYSALLTTSVGLALADDATEGGSAMIARQAMSLHAHQRAVAARAAQFARNLGLPDDVVAAVETAAAHHDDGKSDPRFQIMLYGGDRLTAEIAEGDLAKSGMDPADRIAFRRALRRSGYPPGMRHEALSARIAAHHLTSNSNGLDVDLAVHLIAAHHGRSRPLLPPVTDPNPVTVTAGGGSFCTGDTVDWTAPRRFAQLNNRYGRWGLALLETIVRLADIYCSARNESIE